MKAGPIWLACICALVFGMTTSAHGFEMVREIEVDGQRILIDNTNTRLSIEVVDEFEDDRTGADLARGLYTSYAAAAAAADIAGEHVLPSVSLVYAKGKKFDDGMYAAVEVALEDSFGALQMSKPDFIQTILDRLEERHATSEGFARSACEQAMSCLVSALTVGGQIDDYTFDADIIINERKPIGFYTWSDQLTGIFRRDTALQRRCDPAMPRTVGGTAIVSDIITSDPELLKTYDRLRRIYARLTNRMVGITARDVMREVQALGGTDAVLASEDAALKLGQRLVVLHKPGFALLEPSMSKEMFLLYDAGMLGLSSVDEMIRAIRDGRIDLAPDDTSGWYEYQQYALEPLLMPDQMPEGKKLELGAKYRSLLEEHFKSMISNIRETHSKQLELCDGAAMPPRAVEVTIEPYLAAEPIGTTYLRFAKAYGFLRTVLTEDIDPETLNLCRVPSLSQELDEIQALMRGAHLLTCRDIGLTPDAAATAATSDMATAEEWLTNWTDDPDMERDVRMMIPVARDPDVYWAVIGVRLTKITVRFKEYPDVRAADPSVEVEPSFAPATYWVPTEQFLEIQTDGEPLNREEFRALCDQQRTEEAIRKALPKAIGEARIAEPTPVSSNPGPVTPFAAPWYVAKPWMIWAAAGALMGIILFFVFIRWARSLR